MIEILQEGVFQADDEFEELANRYGRVVIPNSDGDLELTHWWIIKDEGTEMLYVGTPETFTTYIKESNGGVQ